MGTLVELIALAKEMPESHLAEALEKIKEVKAKADSDNDGDSAPSCPHCNSSKVSRNGHKSRKQAYICRECNKSFVPTTKSAMQGSHASPTVWKQVISDTVSGVPIAKTAKSLDLHRETVFNMRHKILFCVESSLIKQPTEMPGVCETDTTYVLESVKGRKIPPGYHRKPRKHGAVASKRGISNEYVCICTSVTSEGKNVAQSVNRATPSSLEILSVFGERVNENTVVLCDGAHSFNALEDRCTVAVTKRTNKVNGFHRFIKEKLDAARGVATIYLNRYNALFAKIYAADESVVDEIYGLMASQGDGAKTIAHTQTVGLLEV